MITRRRILSGMAGAVAAGAAGDLRADTPAKLTFSELYLREQVLSPTCLALTGQRVQMTGFMAPPLKAESRFFVLTSTPLAFCPFCESEVQWPDDIVLVLSAALVEFTPFNQAISVRGTLETGFVTDPQTGFVSLVRIRNGEVGRA